MKVSLITSVALSMVFLSSSYSGELPAVDSSPITRDEPPLVDVTFILPGWLTSVDGTMGIRGLETGVDAPFYDIYKNLDMLAAGSIEARRGRLGLILEGLYLKASFGGDTPGPLLSNVSVSVEQVIAEAALTCRIFENDRAWLEFLAGARYIYLGGELSLGVDSAGVRAASEELSGRIVDRTAEAARQEIDKRLPGLVASLQDEVADLKANAISDIQGRVAGRVEEIKDAIRDRIDGGIGSPGPGFGPNIAGSGAIRDLLRDYVNAKVDAEIEAARARASAAVAQARAKVRREVERRLEKAEAKLAKTIEKEINSRIPKTPVSASRDWVDPFIGFRGRCDLWKDWYLAARGDIGGFGVSSDLMWNLFGALGVQVNERTALEFGYRYLSIDYQSGDFAYDMAIKGPFVGARIDF